MPKSFGSKSKYSKQPSVPYARGFKPPSAGEQQEAVGFQRKILPPEYADSDVPGDRFFTPVPKPTSIDDWLAQYDEEGQSFRQFKQENPWFSKRKQKFLQQPFVQSGSYLSDRYPEGKIYIAKIGGFKDDTNLFMHLLDYVQRFLCLPACVLEGLTIERKGRDLILIEDPSSNPTSRSSARVKRTTLDTRYNAKTGHLQICIDSILPKIQNNIPRDALCLIGLTQYDLYADQSDLFVAGMAAGIRRVAVFSLFRYNPSLSFSKEFWYDISVDRKVPDDERKRLMLQRSCKLLVHELCHLLGVDHCIYYSCCMNGSGHLSEDFDQPMVLCPVDLHKLQALIGFNILERYENLLTFYRQHSLQVETSWVERRITFIQEAQNT